MILTSYSGWNLEDISFSKIVCKTYISYIKTYTMCLRILKITTKVYWRLKFSFENDFLKLAVRFLFEFGTLELDEETLGFLEFFRRIFLEFSSNSTKRWERIAVCKGETSIIKMICHRGTGIQWEKRPTNRKLIETVKNNCSPNDSDVDDESRCGVLGVFIQDFVQTGRRRVYTRDGLAVAGGKWWIHITHRDIPLFPGATTATNEWSSGPVCPS